MIRARRESGPEQAPGVNRGLGDHGYQRQARSGVGEAEPGKSIRRPAGEALQH